MRHRRRVDRGDSRAPSRSEQLPPGGGAVDPETDSGEELAEPVAAAAPLEATSSTSHEGPARAVEGSTRAPPAEEAPLHPAGSPTPESAALYRIHDWKKPRLLSQDQMQALGALHGRFARSLGAAFSVLVRSRVQVELTSTHQGSYFEFLHSLPNPTSLHLVHCHPQRAPMVLEMSLGVLYPMIERLLGGKGDGLSQPLRPLTRIEQKLAEIVASKLLGTLAECWSLGSDLRFDLAEAEHNPLLMQVVGPAEPTLVLGFEVHLGIRSGAFRLALPLKPLDALIARLVDSMAPGPTRSHGTAGEREQLLRQLAPTEVTLSAELVAVPISLHDIVTLRPGDVIDTQIHRGAEVHVFLEGRKLFQGLPALQDGRRAVEITRCLPE